MNEQLRKIIVQRRMVFEFPRKNYLTAKLRRRAARLRAKGEEINA